MLSKQLRRDDKYKYNKRVTFK